MITVIERSLFSKGHNATIFNAFESLVPDIDLKFLACPDGQVHLPSLASNVFPILSPHRNWRKNLVGAISADTSALLEFLEAHHAPKYAPVIIPSASESHIQFALNVLKSHPGSVRFFIRIFTIDAINKLPNEDRNAFLYLIQNGDIKLSTETNSLIELLKSEFGLNNVSNMVLPCSVLPNSTSSLVTVSSDKKHIKIGYLGDIRKEKGADIIPEILSLLSKKLENSSINKEIIFTMPQHPKLFRKWTHLKYHFDLLVSSGNLLFKNKLLNVERYSPFPDEQQFVNLINEMDIIFLPYRKQNYAKRGSGIVLDSVLMGKPIIYSEGIGMSDLLSSGNAMAATSAEDFADCIIRMIKNMDDYQDRTVDARDLLLEQFQNTSDLIRKIN